MKPVSLLFILIGTVDLICGVLLLGVVWGLHRRNRKEAAAAGLPIPASGVGSFAFITLVLLVTASLFYGVAVFVSLE